jgi:hypothetical protein
MFLPVRGGKCASPFLSGYALTHPNRDSSESLSGGSSRIEFSPSGVESGRPAADSGPARNALKSLFFDHHRPLAGATVAERCRATVLSLVEAPWAKSCGEGPVDRSKINRFKYSSIV